MKVWHCLSEPGKYWSFSRRVQSEIDAHGTMIAVNTIFPALWPVVRPRSVTLQMTARLRKPPFDERYMDHIRTWHLREEEVPAHVAVTALVKDGHPSRHSEEAVPELTPQALADWLAHAHAQQIPEERIPILYRLHMYFTRARLLEYQESSAELVFGPKTYPIPVEKREDGLWVSGPMSYTVLDPPITVTLYKPEGQLGLGISVYWSPWIETGSAEAELLKSCLHELEKQGWQAS